jgi:hypothetical protein
MALTLKATHEYWWPVKVSVPADGGKFEARTFEARFTLLAQERFDDLAPASDAAVLNAAVIGWRGIQDEDGAEVAFSAEALSQALQVPYLRAGLIEAYLDSASGRALRKN